MNGARLLHRQILDYEESLRTCLTCASLAIQTVALVAVGTVPFWAIFVPEY